MSHCREPASVSQGSMYAVRIRQTEPACCMPEICASLPVSFFFLSGEERRGYMRDLHVGEMMLLQGEDSRIRR